MALKASFLLFLFACSLLVATKVTSVEEYPKQSPPAPAPEKSHHHHHHHTPEKPHPPKKAPAPEEGHHHDHDHDHHTPEKPHPPKKAPAPEEGHHHDHHHHHSAPPPIKLPTVHYSAPPPKAPTPTKPASCVPACEERCKTHHKKRPCMKTCTACCHKSDKCVPPGTSGNADKCKNWDYVIVGGKKFACP